MNPLTMKARENLTRENIIISCCCGVVFAALTLAFFL